MKQKAPLLSMGMFFFLGVMSALAPVSTDMYIPALPEMTSNFNTTASLIQLTLSATTFGMAVGQIIIGPLSDAYGRKKPLAIGMAVYLFASILASLATSINVFLFARLLQGLAGAAGIVVTKAMARDMASGEALTKLMALLMLIGGLAPIFAPVVGGQILLFGTWRYVFDLMALMGFILCIWSLFVPDTLAPENRRTEGLLKIFKGYKVHLKDRYFLGYCMIQGFVCVVLFSYISGGPFLLQNVYGVSPQVFSYIFGTVGLGVMISGTITGRIAGRFSNIGILQTGIIASTIGSAALLFSILTEATLPVVALSLFVTIFFLPMMFSPAFALAMQFQKKTAGSAAALLGFTGGAMGAMMAPIVGVLGSDTAVPMGLLMLVGNILTLGTFFRIIKPKHEIMLAEQVGAVEVYRK